MDGEGVVWVGTDRGLTALSGEYDRSTTNYLLNATHITQDNGLPSDVIQAVIVDSANVKWIGTTRGLAQVTPSGTVTDLTTNRLVDPDGNVVSLAFDANGGHLWIGTLRGLNKYEAYPPRGARNEVMAQPSSNPYRIELARRGTDWVKTGSPLTMIVSPGARLRIYTVTGELVWEDTDGGIGQLEWDGYTRSGAKIAASGVYVYVAELDGRTTVGKIAVLRDAH